MEHKGVVAAELRTKHPLTRSEFAEFSLRSGETVRQRFTGIVLFDKVTGGYVSVGLPTYAPSVSVAGNKLLYTGIYDGVDLSYEHRGVRVKQDVQLSQAFRESLSTPYPVEDTLVMFVTEVQSAPMKFQSDGADIFDTATPERVDSVLVGDTPLMFPLSDAYLQNDPEQRWQMVKYGDIDEYGSKLLFAGIPYSVVKDTTTYPGVLVLDPTVDLQPDETASKDAYVQSDIPTTNNNSADLDVNDYSATIRRALLQFDISSIPTGSTVTSVTLTMKKTAPLGTPGSPLMVHEITGSWTETGVTWNNQPTYDGSGYSWTVATSAGTDTITHNTGGQFLFDLVQAWISGTKTNNGVIIKYGSEAGGSNHVHRYYSSAAATSTDRPKLSITYVPPQGFKMLDGGLESPLLNGGLLN